MLDRSSDANTAANPGPAATSDSPATAAAPPCPRVASTPLILEQAYDTIDYNFAGHSGKLPQHDPVALLWSNALPGAMRRNGLALPGRHALLPPRADGPGCGRS